MPELLTKYPEVVIDILKKNGAKCNEGKPQKILTSCPSDKFCSLKTGELCVYGIKDAANMTQIDPVDLYFSGWFFIMCTLLIFISGMLAAYCLFFLNRQVRNV